MLLIGISGHKQAGKDTTVDVVRKMLEGASVPIERISLADPLKEELAEFLSTHTAQEILTFLAKECATTEELITINNTTKPFTEIVLSLFPSIGISQVHDSVEYTVFDTDILAKQEYLDIFNDPARKSRFRRLMQWYGTDYIRATDDSYWRKKCIETIKKLDSKWQGQCIIFLPDIRFPDEAKMVKELGGLMFRVERPNSETDTHVSETLMDNYTEFDCILNNTGTIEQYSLEVFEKTAVIFINFFNTL